MQTKEKPAQEKQKAYSNISLRSFITVVVILVVVLAFCASLSYFVPQGEFVANNTQNEATEPGMEGTEAGTEITEPGAESIVSGTYVQGPVQGIEIWRVVTAPFRVFVADGGIGIIMISVFLLVMSGVFNVLDKTGGIQAFIVQIMRKLRDRGGPVVCITVLIFMLFGSLFGMFEELVTLLPLIIVFMLSMKMDTMTGLGACLMAACFGFSAAITNPFSVGTAAQQADIHVSSGAWLRVVFFGIVYLVLCIFLMNHLKKLQRDPKVSPTYENDQKRRESLAIQTEAVPENQQKTSRVYAVFFAIQAVLLVAIACIREISDLAIPLLAASFLISGLICGAIVSGNLKKTLSYFLSGAAAMLPAVVMIALASSVKLVMDESKITGTVMYFVLQMLEGKSKFITILLIYALILFLQIFIGSATAKIYLVMPIVLPITSALGISPNLVILTYCMADGFTDVILPTNPVLLIGLSMANVSYGTWVKWTWKTQLLLFLISILVLLFGTWIGY